MPPQCRISPEPEGAEDLGKHADPALNSKLDSVEQAEAVIGEAAREVGFGKAERRRISLAVHECMVNAVALQPF
ncbi:MAG: hypothetical protein ABSA41_00530 [Terriglobia bacterium]|jgi:anti-sigma regulatory factor (Ser/Thr protein kinase)